MSEIRRIRKVRVELITDDVTYEIELTAPDQIELGGLGDLTANLGLDRDVRELPSSGLRPWRQTVALETATMSLTAHGKVKAERRVNG